MKNKTKTIIGLICLCVMNANLFAANGTLRRNNKAFENLPTAISAITKDFSSLAIKAKSSALRPRQGTSQRGTRSSTPVKTADKKITPLEKIIRFSPDSVAAAPSPVTGNSQRANSTAAVSNELVIAGTAFGTPKKRVILPPVEKKPLTLVERLRQQTPSSNKKTPTPKFSSSKSAPIITANHASSSKSVSFAEAPKRDRRSDAEIYYSNALEQIEDLVRARCIVLASQLTHEPTLASSFGSMIETLNNFAARCNELYASIDDAPTASCKLILALDRHLTNYYLEGGSSHETEAWLDLDFNYAFLKSCLALADEAHSLRQTIYKLTTRYKTSELLIPLEGILYGIQKVQKACLTCAATHRGRTVPQALQDDLFAIHIDLKNSVKACTSYASQIKQTTLNDTLDTAQKSDWALQKIALYEELVPEIESIIQAIACHTNDDNHIAAQYLEQSREIIENIYFALAAEPQENGPEFELISSRGEEFVRKNLELVICAIKRDLSRSTWWQDVAQSLLNIASTLEAAEEIGDYDESLIFSPYVPEGWQPKKPRPPHEVSLLRRMGLVDETD